MRATLQEFLPPGEAVKAELLDLAAIITNQSLALSLVRGTI